MIERVLLVAVSKAVAQHASCSGRDYAEAEHVDDRVTTSDEEHAGDMSEEDAATARWENEGGRTEVAQHHKRRISGAVAAHDAATVLMRPFYGGAVDDRTSAEPVHVNRAMAEHIDPVCGVYVEHQNAAGLSEQKGTTYYFHSEECMSTFNQHPEQYAGKSGKEKPSAMPAGAGTVRE